MNLILNNNNYYNNYYFQMNFELPSNNGWTIYTKSNCIYCVKVKELLKLLNLIINCDDYLLDSSNKNEFLEFIKKLISKEYNTFPIIFDNLKFIGVYIDTCNYISNLNLNLKNIFREFI